MKSQDKVVYGSKMQKYYDAKKSEKKWQKYWEEQGIYRFDPKSKKPVFSIDTPPPYASAGHLHIGHALHYTQFEIIARYRRMAGFNVYFPPCFDNNGLPTEKYVEEKFNISKKDTTRAKFRKLCLKESRKVEKAYADRVFRALGHSYDWSLLYTTIDPDAQKVAQMSFIDLYDKGEAYRSKEPTLWCTKHQTALAQAAVEDVHRMTTLNYIKFDVEGGGWITTATTRPEMLAACVSIFIHPEDPRCKKLVGKKAIVPIYGQKVKIMKEEEVDREFGTGIVMTCTFGDTTDIKLWKKHKLDLRVVINEDGTLNENAGAYKGMTIEEARKRIIRDLKKEGRLKKQEPLQQTVGGCWRCSTPIEFIVTKQWFIRALKHKKELIKQGKKIRWYPEFYRVRYEDWVRNLAWDWCISRQRFYGVPIPVWYCKKCGKEVVAGKHEIPIDPTEQKPKKKCKCGSDELIPDEDVFDTWMTSSMSPEIALRWLEKPKQFKNMFPMSLRPQSHDIIRTWAFYTILKAYFHFKQIPWKDIAIGTYVLDEKGHGMSKSKGNVVWADDMLKKYDVDTFRYWVGTASWGTDLPFKEKGLVTGKRFLTKLWNASKFSLTHLKDYKQSKPKKLEPIDRWLLSKLNTLIKEATTYFDSYNTSQAKKITENFFWHTFCDNYLEIIKYRIYDKNNKTKKVAQHTLYTTLLSLLKMFAPILPHITEEIYAQYFNKIENKKSIHRSDWPKYDNKMIDKKVEEVGDICISIISAVRKFKSKNKMSLKEPIEKVIVDCDEKTKKKIEMVERDIKKTINIKNIEFGKAKQKLEGFDIKIRIEK